MFTHTYSYLLILTHTYLLIYIYILLASFYIGIERLLDTAIKTHDAWSKRLSTWVLNRWLVDTMVSSPMPRAGNKAIAIKFITQVYYSAVYNMLAYLHTCIQIIHGLLTYIHTWFTYICISSLALR